MLIYAGRRLQKMPCGGGQKMHSHNEKIIFYRDRNPELVGIKPGRDYYYQFDFETVSSCQVLRLVKLSKPTQDEMERAISLAEFQKARRGLAITGVPEQEIKEAEEESDKELTLQ